MISVRRWEAADSISRDWRRDSQWKLCNPHHGWHHCSGAWSMVDSVRWRSSESIMLNVSAFELLIKIIVSLCRFHVPTSRCWHARRVQGWHAYMGHLLIGKKFQLHHILKMYHVKCKIQIWACDFARKSAIQLNSAEAWMMIPSKCLTLGNSQTRMCPSQMMASDLIIQFPVLCSSQKWNC